MRHIWVAAVLVAGPAAGQTGPGPSQAALDRAVRLGTVATLAPLCGLRSEAWSVDLRRAAILEAGGAAQPDDEALAAVPGAALIVGALSFAEAEALEDYAEAPPAKTCDPLKRGAELARADAMVDGFRKLKGRTKLGS